MIWISPHNIECKTFYLTFFDLYDKIIQMDRSTVNRNVEIRDLPVVTDNIFNALSLATGKTKLTLYREALIEYGENHKRELMDYVKGIVKDNG